MSLDNVEQAGLDQRATDPRLDVVVEPVVEIPAPEPVAEAIETVVEPEVPVKVKKTAEDVLKGRVGHLTKTLSTQAAALEAAERRAQAAETLLAAGNKTPVEGEEPTPRPAAAPVQDFEAAVNARVEAQEFNRRADEMYNTGAAKYDDWKDSVDTLVASGFMDKDLLDAAMAVEDGPAVLHHLGSNLDEAERINALPPIRKAAEMAKLSHSLAIPKAVHVSAAPAPIKPVAGVAAPQIDLQRIADNDEMSSYIAARAKQGSRWARGRGA